MKIKQLFLALLAAFLLTGCQQPVEPDPSDSSLSSGESTDSQTSSESGSQTSSESGSQTSSESSSQTSNGSNSSTQGNYHGTFYNGITATSGTALLAQVRDLTVNKHTNYNSYDSLGSGGWQKKIDSEDGGKTVRDFYSHAKMAPEWNPSQVYDREHVWPKACSNNLWTGKNPSYGGADAHHIRPEFHKANGNRSNHPFGVVPKGTSVLTHTYNGVAYSYGYLSGDIFEPMDLAKGDVARIVLYVFMHYNTPETLGKNLYPSTSRIGSASSKGSGDLPITNVISASGSKQKAFELLVEWNRIDPPDDLERLRNDELVKSGRTGTRNPFIDHPEWVDKIFAA